VEHLLAVFLSVLLSAEKSAATDAVIDIAVATNSDVKDALKTDVAVKEIVATDVTDSN